MEAWVVSMSSDNDADVYIDGIYTDKDKAILRCKTQMAYFLRDEFSREDITLEYVENCLHSSYPILDHWSRDGEWCISTGNLLNDIYVLVQATRTFISN